MILNASFISFYTEFIILNAKLPRKIASAAGIPDLCPLMSVQNPPCLVSNPVVYYQNNYYQNNNYCQNNYYQDNPYL